MLGSLLLELLPFGGSYLNSTCMLARQEEGEVEESSEILVAEHSNGVSCQVFGAERGSSLVSLLCDRLPAYHGAGHRFCVVYVLQGKSYLV